ncbi:hypothetical protein CF081_19685 [Clostridium botulinum]|uniref:hypothetical protein n=1 Tax=Clostridium botulinum TaxID=1491 RepID=UPI000C78368F|nr:hypothetical protein [Clostridium botulinum]AUN08962.1 hypothetical protein RSJ14_20075 [Clostridium botulinum]
MTDSIVLSALKKFLDEKVCKDVKLEKPPEDLNIEDGDYKLVNPATYIGWIPPKNYLTEYGYDIPSILIMEDGGEDNGDEGTINIRLGIATYDPGDTTELGIEINSKGYKDLLNLITKIRIELAKSMVIEEKTIIEKPIKWGMYEEQQFPYWHAWITFTATILPLNYIEEGINKFL